MLLTVSPIITVSVYRVCQHRFRVTSITLLILLNTLNEPGTLVEAVITLVFQKSIAFNNRSRYLLTKLETIAGFNSNDRPDMRLTKTDYMIFTTAGIDHWGI